MKIDFGNKVYMIWNPGILQSAIQKAFQQVVTGLGEEFKEVIQDENAFPGFPNQDIVDTGELLRNQQLIITNPTSAYYRWGVDYALFVHEGYTLRNGNYQPGRPWTTVAINRYNPRLKFAIAVAKNLLIK